MNVVGDRGSPTIIGGEKTEAGRFPYAVSFQDIWDIFCALILVVTWCSVQRD